MKAVRTIGIIAGAVALAATGVGIALGGMAAGAAAAGGAAALGSTLITVGTIAGVVSGVAGLAANLMQKPPPARGSVTQVIIAVNAPQPYVMGEGYYAGIQRHDCAYGATLSKVPNPYRGMVHVYSGGGPVHSVTPWYDLAPVGSWYSGYLYTSAQLGACPEPSALAPNYPGMPGWGPTAKLSGQTAILWNFLFDKKGKRFASGIGRTGAFGKWVKVYDPRKDSTFPGGSGSHRLGVESTYEWSQSPALHAGTYAYGRYQNGKRTFGPGFPADGIDWACIAAWANVCDANGWTIFGVIYEPGDRWQNLKDIAAAGGGQPIVSSGGKLSFRYCAPTISLDTITPADLAEEPVRITPMQSWGDRINTLIPKYTSANHEWNQVAAGEVSISTYVSEDGEPKTREWPFNLVKDVDQASQLAAYQILDSRELTPIVITCLPRLRRYRPGECLTLALPDHGLETDIIILQRTLDPVKMQVELTVMTETSGKHPYALGQIGTPPPTPALGQTSQERDELAGYAGNPSDGTIFDGGDAVGDQRL